MVKLLAKMLKFGSQLAGRNLDIVFAYPDSPIYSPKDFADLYQLGIKTRPFYWRFVTRAQLADVQKMTGYSTPLKGDRYSIPTDDANNFLDCDFWFVASDRFDEPLAPLRPYCVFAHDYLQRYFPQSLGDYYENGFIQTARNSIAVLANTPHTIEDIVQYVGIDRRKTILVPHLAELEGARDDMSSFVEKGNYFIWTTNAGGHKNQLLTLHALARYYEINRGTLDCHITGVESSLFNPKSTQDSEPRPHIRAVRDYLSERPQLAERIVFHGDLPYQQYLNVISHARFLLHNVVMDNGTLCAVEAAYHRTPVLSSNYPPMRYISQRYGLNATFFDPNDPAELSEKLAWMEANWRAQQELLPDVEHLEKFSWKALAPEFWRQISTIIG